jgi:hypothetical protein
MYQCLGISFKIVGREFRANFVVLDSKGMDIIFGMGWLSKVDAVIQADSNRRAIRLGKGKMATVGAL